MRHGDVKLREPPHARAGRGADGAAIRSAMPFLVQVILPIYDNAGRSWPSALMKQVRTELTEKFGGLTAYIRAPAEGTWRDDEGRTRRDDVVIVEVMTPTLEREWWNTYAGELAIRFDQEELVVRAMAFEDLTRRAAN